MNSKPEHATINIPVVEAPDDSLAPAAQVLTSSPERAAIARAIRCARASFLGSLQADVLLVSQAQRERLAESLETGLAVLKAEAAGRDVARASAVVAIVGDEISVDALGWDSRSLALEVHEIGHQMLKETEKDGSFEIPMSDGMRALLADVLAASDPEAEPEPEAEVSEEQRGRHAAR